MKDILDIFQPHGKLNFNVRLLSCPYKCVENTNDEDDDDNNDDDDDDDDDNNDDNDDDNNDGNRNSGSNNNDNYLEQDEIANLEISNENELNLS